ncbi:MAG TPA: hypothetical protein VH373_06205 [Jatrophihabitantaceae bacterium]|jgi:hypothetical protein
MKTVVRESSDADRTDAASVTAQMPVIDEFTSFDPNAGGPHDPNPPGEAPPKRPPTARPARPDRFDEVSAAEVTAPLILPPAVNHLGGAIAAGAVAVGLAAASKFGVTPLLIGIAVTQGLLIVSWVIGTELPGRVGALVVGALAAAGADFVVSRWPHGQAGTLLGVLALAVPVMFIHQLTRGVVRARVVESLSDIAVLVVGVVALAALMQLRHETVGALMVSALVLAAGGALVAGHVVDAVAPVMRFDAKVPRGLPAVIVGAAVGAAVTYFRLHNTVEFAGNRSLYFGAAVGAIVSLFAVGTAFIEHGLRLAGRWPTIVRPVATAVLSFALLIPVGYLICLQIRG